MDSEETSVGGHVKRTYPAGKKSYGKEIRNISQERTVNGPCNQFTPTIILYIREKTRSKSTSKIVGNPGGKSRKSRGFAAEACSMRQFRRG